MGVAGSGDGRVLVCFSGLRAPRFGVALAEINRLLPGSVVARQVRCGKSHCPRKADPPSDNWWPWERRDGELMVALFLSLNDPDETYAIQGWRDMFLGRVPDHLLVFA